eukprot:CAMPEP_0176422884 /NCGR_PEP_ID=MMETSP0127-20121128/9978_1 /TAXON_ID=938130 /ORGANISM="Platyophrya macrostoma, Strain WH" /LENGTH=1044 /DNA_ID=CAMNT_0017803777 /DNA_START=105 /DNA_END=3239 /DNA_ORIENTATION=+
MIKRKVDDRIKFIIENAAEKKHRGILLLVGDRAKDQIVNLHHLVSRANHSAKVSMLWCMKREVDFGSTGKKRQEKVARLEVKGGMSTEASKEAFQNFLSQTQIRFCQYKETHKVLGQTFGMAVLQDFEAITPNILARTIETVSGGGLIVIMLRAMRSLKQLYTIAMDVHSRYRTEAQHDLVPRFNERFLLSLADCDAALCIDDDLNVLPLTANMRELGATGSSHGSHDQSLVIEGRLQHEAELGKLKERLKGNTEVGPLVQLCQTVDQAKVVLSMSQVIAEKSLNTTVALTAARGRGKSTALGIAIAGAIEQGYSNIFCTAPSPENLQTCFEFIVKGLVAMGYKDRVDFEAMQSTNPDFAKCIVRINVFRSHRQTVQFISANDTERFGQAELLVVDEAAAIPLPTVKRMLGPYLVFLSTTVSGYEGTGRALSMKLVSDMRKHMGASVASAVSSAVGDPAHPLLSSSASSSSRALRELAMADPIRYGPGDPIEAWLNKLLCLDATSQRTVVKSCPHPSTCELYYVNRDALFSFHPAAEKLLHQVMSLLVAAHYKNQPNDLQLMSDAPGHHLFVLCGPVSTVSGAEKELPDIFCVIHACEEGHVSSVQSQLAKGVRPSGDLIPYTMAQYFLQDEFAKLSGLRVIRIATNPELQRSGYGTRALSLLRDYYAGKIALEPAAASASGTTSSSTAVGAASADGAPGVSVRKHIPALLTPIHERPFEALDYIGVSFGATSELFHFWKKNGFDVVYIRQVPNEITGEHSCIMLSPVELYDVKPLQSEFRRRFLSLLAQSFRQMSPDLALAIAMDLAVHSPHVLERATEVREEDGGCLVDGVPQLTVDDLKALFTNEDMKRLKLCSTAYVDNSVVWDLVPKVARLYFDKKCFRGADNTEGVVLSHAQAAVLLAVGLQCRHIDDLASVATFQGVQTQQLRAFLNKSLSRLVEHFLHIVSSATAGNGQSKRPREDAEVVDEDGMAEVAVERYDKEGNLVGVSVSKRVQHKIDTDSTLRRDATMSSAVVAGGPSSRGGDASRSQQKMKMSKKTRQR